MTISRDALALIAAVNKKYGEGAVVLGSDIKIAKRFPSGSLSLDVALGGGWPANQWVEVIGHESHGKTAIVYKTLAANQLLDPNFTTLWIAAEHYDSDQAEALGVDNARVIVHPTQGMEEAYETMLLFAASKSVDAVVLDSYPALVADEEAEKGMDESVMAVGARLTGKFFRKAGAARRSLTDETERPFIGFFINQYRDAIGQWSPQGTPLYTPGGRAKNYAFYVRAEVRRAEWIQEPVRGKDLKVNVGQTIKIKTIKNKSSAPQQTASVDFYFRDAPVRGFKRGEYDASKELKIMGILFDVINRHGAWFSFDNGQIDSTGKPLYRWQGTAAVEAALRTDIGLQEEVRAAIFRATKDPTIQRDLTDDDVVAAVTAGTKKVVRRKKTEEKAA
jgi:recombination protein RecA